VSVRNLSRGKAEIQHLLGLRARLSCLYVYIDEPSVLAGDSGSGNGTDV
jgi:hypothetical protein